MLPSTSAVNPVSSGGQPTDVPPTGGGEKDNLHPRDTGSSVIILSKSAEGTGHYIQNNQAGSPSIRFREQQPMTSTPTTMDMETDVITQDLPMTSSSGLI